MKAVTLNTWGSFGPPQRQPVLKTAIRKLNADLLLLQEVVDPVFLEEFPFPVRLHSGRGQLALLSRFPLLSFETITFAACSRQESYTRQALLAELDFRGNSLWAVTTHLSWRENDEPTRSAQCDELVRRLKSLEGPVLLSGDFNTEPGRAPIQKIVRAGFIDLFAALHPADPGITWDNTNPFIQSHSVRFPDRRIDYLFLRQDVNHRLQFLECSVVCRTPSSEGIFPSDHYGVLVDLQR